MTSAGPSAVVATPGATFYQRTTCLDRQYNSQYQYPNDTTSINKNHNTTYQQHPNTTSTNTKNHNTNTNIQYLSVILSNFNWHNLRNPMVALKNKIHGKIETSFSTSFFSLCVCVSPYLTTSTIHPPTHSPPSLQCGRHDSQPAYLTTVQGAPLLQGLPQFLSLQGQGTH